jgi:hypothetical protein
VARPQAITSTNTTQAVGAVAAVGTAAVEAVGEAVTVGVVSAAAVAVGAEAIGVGVVAAGAGNSRWSRPLPDCPLATSEDAQFLP